MSSCRTVREALPLFVGGDLDPDRAAAVGSHLRDCPGCRREAVALQQPLRRLRRLPVPVAGDAFFAELQGAILDRVEAAAGSPASRWAGALGGRRTWMALAGLLAATAGLWALRPAAAPSVLQRAPITIPVDHRQPPLVVPHAGPRVELQPLGAEPDGPDPGGSVAPGMMGRWRLRTLVDEEGPRPDLPPR
ncbi:MAG: zf-HC2 domain-containing protein [Planctomycetes bacterium]|nr:zf-HC2 domain-containing protein [Planctomycetota bacterium]